MKKPIPYEGDLTEATRALSQARIALMGTKGSAFITAMCFSLKHVWTTDVDRAATDGFSIYYNPHWFVTIPHKERVGIVVHETWHVCLNHCKFQRASRMTNHDPKLWNIACDGVINNFVLDAGFKLPKDRIDMPEARGQSTEKVYRDLLEKQERNEDIPDLSDALSDIREPDPNAQQQEQGEGESDKLDIPQELKAILARAALTARLAGEDAGNLSAEMKFMLDNLLNPKLPWTRLMERYFNASIKTSYSFSRPNRRHYPRLYLPTRSGKTLEKVNMAIDMSASVSNTEIAQFVSEVIDVLTKVKPKKLMLVEFDTRVRQVTQLRDPSQLRKHEFVGRGGTFINPVIDYQNENPSEVLVIFTDGRFYPPTARTRSAVLWVIYNNPSFAADFGKVIHVNI